MSELKSFDTSAASIPRLNALDADRDLFEAELTLAQIRLDELSAVVQLDKPLGGGWRPPTLSAARVRAPPGSP